VQASESFKKMDSAMQKKVMEADGTLMASYIRIFNDEKRLLLAAKKEMLASNQEVIQDALMQMKKAKQEKAKDEETQGIQVEQKQGEDLLQQLNKI
jgi:hypothetical protein